MPQSSKTAGGSNVHDSIFANSEKEEPTMNQCKYLIYLYRESLKAKILKRHTELQRAKVSDFPFFAMANRKPSSFAIHLLNTFSVSDNLNRGAISKLIDSAKNQSKFDAKFISSFLDSANRYYKTKNAS